MDSIEAETAAQPEPVAAPKINLLLVDDEARNLEVLESVLASPELRLVRAKNSEQALLALVQDEFACIVMDIQMPDMSGLELSRLIKSRKRNQYIPIIFLTAYFLEERDILQGYGAGAVDYLVKPVNPQILRSKVGVFVDLFRTTRALASANNMLENEILQRKKAEQALRLVNNELEIRVEERTADLSLTEQRYRQLAAIVESSEDAIIGRDLNGIITSWNDGARRIFGYHAQEVIGKPISILFPPERRSEEPVILEKIRQGSRVEPFETVRRCKDGNLIDISLTISPVKNADGKIIGASKIARNITERKQAERKLKKAHGEIVEALRAKDDFLAALSHELRTPLSPALLIASDGANNHELTPGVRADFNAILKHIELEARLIDDLLDLTRITNGKILLDKRPVDVNSICKDAIGFIQNELREKKLNLKVDLQATPSIVHADPVRLQQVFWNLLKNAIKFTPSGGSVMVASEVAGGSDIIVRIVDTGIGIEPDEIDRLFNTFSQGGNARRFGGLGLGLAISKRLVKFHAGEIHASSKGRDQGTSLTVKLPLVKGDEYVDGNAGDGTALSTAKVPARPPQIVRVLLVEDHESTRKTLSDLLKRRHYEVVAVASIAEALAQVNSFQVLISDIGLPDGNGCDLLIEMRKRGPIQGIALTGFGMDQDITKTQKAGFLMHLTKPVKIQALENALVAAAKLHS